MNGHEVFKNIKYQKHLKHLPVIMLSRSSSRENAKLIDENEFLKMIGSIKEFWRPVVQLPKNN